MVAPHPHTQAGCLHVAWDDAAALRGNVLSRLMDVNMQCKLRSVVSHLSTAAYRLAPALLAIAGVDCFDPSVSWAHGATSHRGGLDSDKWRQVTSLVVVHRACMMILGHPFLLGEVHN